MIKIKALEIKFECNNCGYIFKRLFPADTIKMLKAGLAKPDCNCGGSNNHILEFTDAILEQIKTEE